MQRFHFTILFALIIVFFFSCTKDKLNPGERNCTEEITYTAEIRSIVNNSCAYAGCHDGANAPGDYTTYEAMLPILDDTDFRSRVIEVQDMPPSYAIGPTKLNEEELTLINCWLSTGFKK